MQNISQNLSSMKWLDSRNLINSMLVDYKLAIFHTEEMIHVPEQIKVST